MPLVILTLYSLSASSSVISSLGSSNPVCCICRLLFMMDYFLMFLTMLSTLGGLNLYPMGTLGSGNMTQMLLLVFCCYSMRCMGINCQTWEFYYIETIHSDPKPVYGPSFWLLKGLPLPSSQNPGRESQTSLSALPVVEFTHSGWNFTLLTDLYINLLLLNGCWQETQYSRVRDSKHHEHHLCVSLPCSPGPTGMMQKSPDGASLVAQWWRIICQCRRHGFHLWSRQIPPAVKLLTLCLREALCSGPIDQNHRRQFWCWSFMGQTLRNAAIKNEITGTSLVIQWLRLYAPSAGEPGLDPWSGS